MIMVSSEVELVANLCLVHGSNYLVEQEKYCKLFHERSIGDNVDAVVKRADNWCTAHDKESRISVIRCVGRRSSRWYYTVY